MKQQKDKLSELRARHGLRKGGEIKQVDMMEDSLLLKMKSNLKDIVSFEGHIGLYKRVGGQRLPRNTLESFYEHVMNDRLESLHPIESQLDL